MNLVRGGGGQEAEEYIYWPPLPFFYFNGQQIYNVYVTSFVSENV